MALTNTKLIRMVFYFSFLQTYFTKIHKLVFINRLREISYTYAWTSHIVQQFFFSFLLPLLSSTLYQYYLRFIFFEVGKYFCSKIQFLILLKIYIFVPFVLLLCLHHNRFFLIPELYLCLIVIFIMDTLCYSLG